MNRRINTDNPFTPCERVLHVRFCDTKSWRCRPSTHELCVERLWKSALPVALARGWDWSPTGMPRGPFLSFDFPVPQATRNRHLLRAISRFIFLSINDLCLSLLFSPQSVTPCFFQYFSFSLIGKEQPRPAPFRPPTSARDSHFVEMAVNDRRFTPRHFPPSRAWHTGQ